MKESIRYKRKQVIYSSLYRKNGTNNSEIHTRESERLNRLKPWHIWFEAWVQFHLRVKIVPKQPNKPSNRCWQQMGSRFAHRVGWQWARRWRRRWWWSRPSRSPRTGRRLRAACRYWAGSMGRAASGWQTRPRSPRSRWPDRGGSPAESRAAGPSLPRLLETTTWAGDNHTIQPYNSTQALVSYLRECDSAVLSACF